MCVCSHNTKACRALVFFADGRKAVTTQDSKYPKNTQNTRKNKIIIKNNQQWNFRDHVFFANGIQIVKTAKNRCTRKKTRFTVIPLSVYSPMVTQFENLTSKLILECETEQKAKWNELIILKGIFHVWWFASLYPRATCHSHWHMMNHFLLWFRTDLGKT